MVTLATSISNVKNSFRSAPNTSFSRQKLSYFRNPRAPTSMVTRSTINQFSSISSTKSAYFISFRDLASSKLVSKHTVSSIKVADLVSSL